MLHACFVRSPFARAASTGSRCPSAGAARRARRVRRGRPQPRGARALVHVSWAATSRTRLGRRWPRARCASSATRSPWSSPTSRYIAEDAVELVDVDYDPLPAGRRLRSRRVSERLVHDGVPGQPRRRARRAAAGGRSTTWSPPAAHVVEETDPPAGVRRGADGDAGPRRRVERGQRRADDLGGDAGPPRGAGVLLAPARDPRAPDPGDHARHRRRVRSEGHPPARGDAASWSRPARCRPRSSGSRTGGRT